MADSSTTATAENTISTAATSAAAAATSTTAANKTVNLHIVSAYNRGMAIKGLDVSFENMDDGEEFSGTTDDQGNISLTDMSAGTYNVHVTDTYGNYTAGESSFSVSPDQTVPVNVPVPVAKIQVIYQNSSQKSYQEPSYTVSGVLEKTYKLSALAAGTNVTDEAGYIVNGASCLVTARSEVGIMAQHYFMIPMHSSKFYVRIHDRNRVVFIG